MASERMPDALARRLAALSPAEQARLKAALRAKQAQAEASAPPEPAKPKPVATIASRIPTLAAAASHAMSHAQQRLAVIQALAGSSEAYHLGGAFELDGNLDVVALERALRAVVARHESLRTRFADFDGELRQVVQPVSAWRGFAMAEGETPDWRAAAAVFLAAPLDLAADDLFAVRLWRDGAARWGLVFKLHHIIADGASLGVLMQDLSAAYGGGELPPLALQYRDYAAWSRGRLESEELAPTRAYWKNVYTTLPEPLALNTDAPRPRVQDTAGAHARFALPGEVAQAVEAIGRKAGATPFMTWLATVYAVLGRWTGQTDVVIGTPVAGRELPELREQIGFFVNSLPLRLALDPAESFGGLLGKVRTAVIEGVTHQAYPFDRLVEELRLERDLSRSPLFDAMMGYEETGPPLERLFGCTAREVALETSTSKVDVTFHLKRTAAGLGLDLEYARALFAPERMARLAASWAEWVTALIAQPARAWGDLSVVPAAERERQFRAFNAAGLRLDYPREADVVSLWAEQVAARSDAPAVHTDDGDVSYAEIDVASNALAARLANEGEVKEAEPVALMVERSPRMVVALLAILKTGAAYLPLNRDTPAERVAGILRDAGCRWLLHDGEAPAGVTDGGARAWSLGAENESAPTAGGTARRRSARSLSYIIFTSGSTGRPKGTLVEDRAVVRLVRNTNYAKLDPAVRILQTGSLAFDASTFEIWGALLNGGCLCLPRGQELLDIEGLGALLQRHRATTLFLTTGLFNQVVEFAPDALGQLETVLTGGEKVSLRHVNAMRERFPRLKLVHVYGPTENTTFSSYHVIDRVCDHDVPIGGPIAHSTLWILDARGQPVPIGVTGEVYCGGEGLARGYLNRPALTAEKFVPHPFGEGVGERLYRTGDTGYWDEHGQVVFVGRTDDQVKIRGFRVELGEIETALRALPGVQHAVVVARPLGGTHELVAYYVPKGGARDPAAWREALAVSLPAYMLPAHWVALDALPLNANGKVDRRRLPAPQVASGSGKATATDNLAPISPVETEIAPIWATALGLATVPRDGNFFSLGGDSIKAIQIVARLRQLNYALKLPDVFARPTLAGLAQLLAARPKEGGAAVTQAPLVGPTGVTPVQRWFWENFPAPRDRFCQTTLLHLPAAIDGEVLRQAWSDVLRHHDALRGTVGADGAVVIRPLGDNECWVDEAVAGSLVEATDRLLARISLETGPIAAAARYRLPHGDRLLIVVHHWAIDGVSWRILAEDFQAALAARSEGRAPDLPLKTAAAGTWGAATATLIERPGMRKVAQRWSRQLERARDVERGWRTTWASRPRATKRALSFRVGASEADCFAPETHRAFRSEPLDLLLGGLARAWRDQRGESALALTLEGHGREPLPGAPEIERTVGWFTSLCPLVVDAHAGDDARLVRSVRTARAALPDRGASFLPLLGDRAAELPAISFNYLGAFGGGADDGQAWTPAPEETAAPNAPHLGGPFGIDIVVTREGDDVAGRVFYDPAIISTEEVETLVAAWRGALGRITGFCGRQAEVVPSPPDFTCRGLDVATVDRLAEQNGRRPAEIRDMLPLGPMQAGLLAHYLQDPTGGAYCDTVVLRVAGPLERAAFDRAWARLLARHPNLTARFWHRGGPEPVQVVLNVPTPAPTWHDGGDEAEDAPAAVARRERLAAVAYDLALEGPLRLDVVRRGPARHEWIVRFHHIALDGWSSGLVMRELVALYAAQIGPAAEPVLPAVTFAAYLGARQDLDRDEARRYWTDLLADAPAGAEVPPAVARLAVVDEPASSVSIRETWAGEDYAALRAFAGDQGVTLNTVVQTAWALLLGQWNASRDVVYGVTVSGRDGSEPGVESIIGLLINTLPLRARWGAADTALDLLRRVQEQGAASLAHAGIALAELPAVEGGERFTHTLIFENYPEQTEGISFVDADGKTQRWETEVIAVNDPMHFEFGLLVAPGADTLQFRAVVDPRLYPESYGRDLLAQLSAVLRALMARPETPIAALPRGATAGATTVEIVATFTAEPILPVLRYWSRALSLPVNASCAPFNQVFQTLWAEAAPVAVRGVLVRLGDWLPDDVTDAPAAVAHLEPVVDDVVDALRASIARNATGHAVVVLTPETARWTAGLADLRRRLRRRLAALDRVECVDGEELATLYACAAWADDAADALGAVPYQPSYYAVLGTALMRVLDRRARPPLKVVATDADETLWSGVVGEDGIEGLTVPPLMSGLHLRLAALEASGCLLAVCSKNAREDVERVLAEHPALADLRPERFVAVRANWQPKSENLAGLAEELGLGLDSFLFLDDNPVELEAVRTSLPAVRTIAAPPAASARPDFWSHVWCLDTGAATAEDRGRTKKYREHASRETVRRTAGSLADFLASLQLEVAWVELATDWERAAQLTVRTNQFHACPSRRDAAALQTWVSGSPDRGGFLVSVKDRFGDYGRCGLVLFETKTGGPNGERVAVVETFLLSCRALGRGVEHAMLRELARRVAAAGARQIDLLYRRTARNEPVARFLQALPGDLMEAGEIPARQRLSVAEAAAVAMPMETAAPAAEEGAAIAAGGGGMSWDRSAGGRLYARIADTLGSAEEVAAAVQTAQPRGARRRADGERVEPRTELETTLREVWAEVLGRPAAELGCTDDFFAVGGHSLNAVQVLSRLALRTSVEVSLETFFASPTIEALATAVATAGPAAVAVQAAPMRASYPLSRVQRRFWILENARGAGPSPFHMTAAFRIIGAMDGPAFGRALAGLLQRHEALRTAFVEEQGEPVQRIFETVATPLVIGENAMTLEAFHAEAAAWSIKPFEFGVAPLLRVWLQRLTPDGWGLAIVLHHLVGDGWSVAIIARELAALYAAEIGEIGPPGPSPRFHYKDFSWDERMAAKAHGEADRAFWLASLAERPAPLELPADRPRPVVKTTRGATVAVRLGRTEWEALKALGQGAQVTGFGVALAVLRVFLARYAGAWDTVVGTPVAGRSRAEWEPVVGCFVNLLALRGRVERGETFGDLLARAGAELRAALAHQRYPFDEFVRAIAPERDPSRAPLFDVLLAFQNAGSTELRLGDAKVEDIALGSQSSQYDWTLNCFESEAGLDVVWEYDTALFDAERMAGVAAAWRRLAAELAGAPDRGLETFELTDAAERAQLLEWGGAIAELTAVEATIPALVDEVVRRAPTAEAVVDAAGGWTYAELAEAAQTWAASLRDRVRPGEVVGVVGPRNREWIAAQLGIMRAGAIYLPLDAAYPPARLRGMADDSGMVGWIWTGAENEIPAALAELGPRLGRREGKPGATAGCAEPGAVAYMIFTSGSTGRPKGVEVTHRAFASMICAQVGAFGVTANDRAGQFASAAFDASLSEVYLALTTGATLCLAPESAKADLHVLKMWIREQAISVITLPPALVAVLPAEDLGSVRTLITAGERADAAVVNRLRGRLRYINAYGPTEAAVCTTTFDASAAGEIGEPVPIGRPLASTAVRVLDDCGRLAPVGVVGELGVLGPTLAEGYHGRAHVTAESFVQWADPAAGLQRLYRTGDLVSWGRDGQLRFHGRRDHQVKIRGHRIELGEVEAVARTGGGVEDALALVESAPPRLLLYVRGQGIDVESLTESLRASLPDYMVPAAVMAVARWPLSPNGKIDRAKLPAPGTHAGANGAAPATTPAELAVASAWAAVLGNLPMTVATDFFAAGGDSIRALQVIARLRTAGWQGRLAELFRAPRLGAFAGSLERSVDAEGGAEVSDALAPIQRWFFAAHPEAPYAQFNQAVSLILSDEVDLARLGRAWRRLVARHASLRSRFGRADDGAWRRRTDAPAGAFPTRELAADSWTDGRVSEAVEALQAGFSLESGPLVQSLLVTVGDVRRLVLVAHHLIVDWVSWRLWLTEWEQAYRADRAGEAIVESDVYGAWVASLERWSRAAEREGLVARWKARQSEAAAATAALAEVWPRASWGCYGDVVVGAAAVALTKSGGAGAGSVLRNRILAALLRVLGRALGVRRLAVELESHGRGLAPGGEAIEGAVGWFTALYPVVGDVAADDAAAGVDADPELDAASLALGAYRADLPAKADCAVGFNFLGTMDGEAGASEGTLWQLTDDALPGAIHPRFPRDHAVDCTAYVWNGALQVRIAGVPALTDQATVQAWAEEVVRMLERANHG